MQTNKSEYEEPQNIILERNSHEHMQVKKKKNPRIEYLGCDSNEEIRIRKTTGLKWFVDVEMNLLGWIK